MCSLLKMRLWASKVSARTSVSLKVYDLFRYICMWRIWTPFLRRMPDKNVLVISRSFEMTTRQERLPPAKSGFIIAKTHTSADIHDFVCAREEEKKKNFEGPQTCPSSVIHGLCSCLACPKVPQKPPFQGLRGCRDIK
jgi:hypothetical protein